ncbi:MAG: MarR family transcriptional regulator [Myxococcota bacterium]
MRSRIVASRAARQGSARALSRYRDNAARHLIGISRDLQGRLIRLLSGEYGYRGLRPSLGPFLSLVWIEGRPLTAIASQLGISKQACGQLANLAERAGYLERKPDPQDRRAKLVMLSPRGRALIEHAVGIIGEIESEYAGLVGRQSYRRLTMSLASLYEGMGIPTHADRALTAAAKQSVGLLPLIAVRVQQDLMEATIGRGHVGLKMSHGLLLPFIAPEGARVHQIARIQRVSRQAISATSQDLEALGYLRRETDPRDRRGVVLRLTKRGTRLIRDSVAALDGLERSFRDILGAPRLEQFQQVARDLYRALHLEEEIFAARAEGPAEPNSNGDPRLENGANDIHGLAKSLRRQLGRHDSARLAALLEPRAKSTAT